MGEIYLNPTNRKSFGSTGFNQIRIRIHNTTSKTASTLKKDMIFNVGRSVPDRF
jgi:hypothetical protein